MKCASVHGLLFFTDKYIVNRMTGCAYFVVQTLRSVCVQQQIRQLNDPKRILKAVTSAVYCLRKFNENISTSPMNENIFYKISHENWNK